MSVPRPPGTVYRAFAADGTLLYVGMTTYLERRLKDHARKAAWWPLHARIEHDPPLPVDEALRSETDQITLLKPRFNCNAGNIVHFGADTTTSQQAHEWKALYEAGATIEEIALDAHVGIHAVRRHLHAVGISMRAAKPQVGKSPGHLAHQRAKPSADSKVVHVPFTGTRGVHRRRGEKA